MSVTPIAPAKAGSKGVSFPITGGTIDPATAAGTITHSGGLQLRAGATRVRLTSFTIGVDRTPTHLGQGRQGAPARVHALAGQGEGQPRRAGHERLRRRRQAQRQGRGGAQQGVRRQGVHARPAHRDGDGQGHARRRSPSPAEPPRSRSIPAPLRRWPRWASAAAPAAPATANPDGSLAFPITGGKVDAKTLAGSITHSGGLTLTKGATAVTVTDFTIETAPAPKLTALLGTTRFDLATLDLERGQGRDLRARR